MSTAAVIPSYKVKDKIIDVIRDTLPFVDFIYIVDDCCPQNTASYVLQQFKDSSRVKILINDTNLGVGGAVIRGYQQAIKDGIKIIVKIDGDGQMDSSLIPAFVKQIESGNADYVKGNRFFSLSYLQQMPSIRLLGNSILSFVSKLSSGYWGTMDPTNGFTAIHRSIAANCGLDKLNSRYFFESDLLFRLNIIKAKVVDLPMPSLYGNEISNLRISSVALTFPFLYFRNLMKRIIYSYFLRDFNLGSLSIINGTFWTLFGLSFGAVKWIDAAQSGHVASSGTVMIAALPIVIGFLSYLSFANFDVMSVPGQALHPYLSATDNSERQKSKDI